MAGVASQSKSLAQNEVFELPPYADEILLEGGSLTAESSADGSTFYAITVAVIATGLYKVTDPSILPKIKITSSGGGTVHYRVSKR
jgi:hypothetical protein